MPKKIIPVDEIVYMLKSRPDTETVTIASITPLILAYERLKAKVAYARKALS